MRWRGGRRSENIEDRRATRLPGGVGGTVGISGLGLVIVLVLGLLFGQNPLELLALLAQGGGLSTVQDEAPPGGAAPTDEAAEFVSVVLASTEDVWSQVFATSGSEYRRPRLVLYTDVVQSGCGVNEASTGPFYCPGDEKVYLDLGFLGELQRRLDAPGDFAVAYVIAHEIGHHVQHLQGIDVELRRLQSQVGPADANALSVLAELQADCYAGLWAQLADAGGDFLDEADIEEGLNAAAAVGDDRLLARSGRAVQRDAFTHGSSEERVRWFRAGWDTADVQACDTFADAGLR